MSNITGPVSVRRCALPIAYRQGADRAVLLVHGYTGYPGELAYPAARLADAGWDIQVPRLTGHGTSGADFSKTATVFWRRQVRDEWLNLSSRYADVAVIGHSMGGLLALDLAETCPVGSLVLMAPAIGIRRPGLGLLGPFSFLKARVPFPWKPDPMYEFFDERDDDDDEYLGAEYWSWIWLKQLSGLLGLQKSVERRLWKIRSRVLGIFAQTDTVVGHGGRDILKKALRSEYREELIEDCGHYIPYDPKPGNKERAMELIIRWLDATESRGR